MLRTLDDYISARIEVDANGCWLWTGLLDKDGYGIAFWPSEDKESRKWRAHRLVYEHKIGPIPDGLVLDHIECEVHRCANPAHVVPVTSRANTLRSETALAAINARKTACPRGHAYDGVNKAGQRICRQCHRDSNKKWRREHYCKGG